MHFVVGKNGIDARKKAKGVVIHTPEPSDNADAHFYHNPAGAALFSARFVAAFAGMNNYLTQAASCGGGKDRWRKIYNLTEDTP